MIDREDLTCWIHHSMAITGVYLGVYALLCRDDFFGNALTSNMIYIVTSLFGQNLMDVTIVLSKKYHKKLYPYSLAVTGLAIIILGFLPERMNAVVGLYPIFFAMAFQWNSFPGAYGYNASCIFSTNNCRQIANALTEYSITHEKKLLKKAWFFFGTVLCFHLGVAFSWLTHYFIGIRSVWLCVIPLAVSAVLIYWEAQLDKQPEPSVCKKIPAAVCIQVAEKH